MTGAASFPSHGTELEFGLRHQGGSGAIYYELNTGGALNTWASATAVIVDKPGHTLAPQVDVATVRLGTAALALDAGRVGISLGLTPPVYATQIPVASRPSIYGVFERLSFRAFGVPDYGAGLVGNFGAWSYSLHAYRPQQLPAVSQALLGLQAGALDASADDFFATTNANRTLTPDCSLCALVSGVTGLESSRNDRFDRYLVGLLQRRMATQATASPSAARGAHAGLYYQRLSYRAALDVAHTSAFGGLWLAVPAAEWDFSRGSAGVQGFGIQSSGGGTYGGHAWAIADPFDGLGVYARIGHYDGATRATEYGAGLMTSWQALHFKFGYEFLNVDFFGVSQREGRWMSAIGVSL